MKKILFFLLALSNVGLAQNLIVYSRGNTNLSALPMYSSLSGSENPSTAESMVSTPTPMIGVISNMLVQLGVAPGQGNVVTFTLRNKQTSQSLSCTILNTATSCSDLVHSSATAIGDLLDWQIMPGGSITSLSSISIVVQYQPSFPNGLVFLCQASTPVASLTIGPCVIPDPPPGKQWRKIIEVAYVSAYGSPGDTVGDRYNGDANNNYRFECNTMAAGGTTFAAGTNTATQQSVLKMAPADSQLNRNILAIINSDPSKAEKTVQVLSLTGTGSVTSQAAFDVCNGAWVSPVNVGINSVTQVTLTANMGANSGFVLFGLAW